MSPYTPLPNIIEGEEEYEVEDILNHWTKGKHVEYYIKWKGYDCYELLPPGTLFSFCPPFIYNYHMYFSFPSYDSLVESCFFYDSYSLPMTRTRL